MENSAGGPPAGRRRGGKREKLADQVAAVLEERILDGTFAPGSRLPVEFDIAEDLNVSRTVVRDAIRALATRRLVDVRQGLGTVVTPPSTEAYAEAACILLVRSDCTLGDLWDARELLDTQLTVAGMRSGEADWEPARQALADYREALGEGRADDAGRFHHRFHLALLTALHNPVLDLLLAPMQEIITATSRAPWAVEEPDSWAEDFDLHPPMLEAAVAGDEPALRAAVKRHYAFRETRQFGEFRDLLLRESPVARTVLHETRGAGRLARNGGAG